MKAELRYYDFEKHYILDLEAENDQEIEFLRRVKKEGLMAVQLNRKDAESFNLPSECGKKQIHLEESTLSELAGIFKLIFSPKEIGDKK